MRIWQDIPVNHACLGEAGSLNLSEGRRGQFKGWDVTSVGCGRGYAGVKFLVYIPQCFQNEFVVSECLSNTPCVVRF